MTVSDYAVAAGVVLIIFTLLITPAIIFSGSEAIQGHHDKWLHEDESEKLGLK